ncbi:MAG: DNA repair protein RecN [Acidobacteriota bacterium]
MLRFLSIQNFALIERLQVEFGHGLSLITGETGSGKSILVDAVGLLVGQRASQEMIREGFDCARVEGVFSVHPNNPLRARLEKAGIDLESDELVIRREITTAGSNKVFINEVLSTQGSLAKLRVYIADIHGQHDQQQLLQARTHLQFLDAYGRNDTLLSKVAHLYSELKDVVQELSKIRAREREFLRRIDNLRFELREIEDLKLRPGLDEELEQEKTLLSTAESRLHASQQAYHLLYEADNSAVTQLGQARKCIEELGEVDSTISKAVEKLAACYYQLEELSLELRDYAQSIEFNPGRLDAVEDRLAQIQKAKRKYGETLEQIFQYREDIAGELKELSGLEARSEALSLRRETLNQQYLKRARQLSTKRRTDAKSLCRRVQVELAELAMANTLFRPEFETSDQHLTEQGIDTLEFLISPNPGESPKPMSRIASGGELSRIILALKSILTLENYSKTLVFDEVDAGIGGRVASMVGEKLSRLARRHQVLCVTHLPQIAAYADHHFHVGKESRGPRTRIWIRPLEPSTRVQELARMLAGKKMTSTTLRQAREMLAHCASSTPAKSGV